MHRLFYDLHERGSVCVDSEGIEFTDLSEARRFAVCAARDVMKADIAQGRLCLSNRIVVRNEHGATVLSLAFGDAVRFVGR